MLEQVQELIDNHNVINTLEGFSQYSFNKKEVSKEETLFFLNFDRNETQHYRIRFEYINISVLPDYVVVVIQLFDPLFIKYLQKKYNSGGGYEFVTFSTSDLNLIKDFIQKDVDYLLDNTA